MNVLVLGVFLLPQAVATRGVRPSDGHLYSTDSFACDGGARTMDPSRINDNYCDCKDGSDEPGTSACANGKFFCNNAGFQELTVPSSRVNDGLCDCCDGSDEWATGVCEDTCKEKAREAYKDQIQQLETIKKGLAARETLVEEGRKLRLEKEKIRDEATGKQEEIQRRVDEIQKLKDELEAAEKPQEEESTTQDESKTDEEKAKEAPADPSTEEEPEANADTPQAEEAFPYPKEYAAPQGDSDGDSGGEAFPYPKEYAAPDQDADDNEDDDAPPQPDEYDYMDDAVDDDDIPERPQPDEESQALKDARDQLRTTQRELNDWKKKAEEAEKFLKDVGGEDAFLPLYHKCFEKKVRQYTYEVCLFKDSYQKEGSSRTNLGKFVKYNEESMEMEFERGQTCWNGPQRSIKVKLECGGENELGHVDEPSKCVYATTLKTPAACDKSKAEELEAMMQAIQ
uniref:Glucosidase 2 subunit beta n=1 Tax=Lotharella globosa TaxID=91324 RepID=A0A7S3Z9M4_9EUKA|mmetsp:Transcript_10759/g.21243  ORF Transcript_10759/g.21243 Transcript_10759/m.21243 type:complete len:455 (-) Transcript_10759:116-1480(-)|eukprot:CAMPEP_0167786494 /NCGR_PEP_ID=MMETSP0111_2-20121227/8830_1 /TAXON_ID=91324 /ORGANISM="Lotharella globosa, Strain CCCM811" /LENGTH=454 /DNA_ID=CAMNT_0007677895 /DNA_START=39 /DNA_END=1403 /DNA_ORIENTATION=-